jgi:hypothetical protein
VRRSSAKDLTAAAAAASRGAVLELRHPSPHWSLLQQTRAPYWQPLWAGLQVHEIRVHKGGKVHCVAGSSYFQKLSLRYVYRAEVLLYEI